MKATAFFITQSIKIICKYFLSFGKREKVNRIQIKETYFFKSIEFIYHVFW